MELKNILNTITEKFTQEYVINKIEETIINNGITLDEYCDNPTYDPEDVVITDLLLYGLKENNIVDKELNNFFRNKNLSDKLYDMIVIYYKFPEECLYENPNKKEEE